MSDPDDITELQERVRREGLNYLELVDQGRLQAKQIKRLESQVQEKDQRISELESAAHHVSELGEKDVATIAYLRSCLKRLEWSSGRDQCPACGAYDPCSASAMAYGLEKGTHASDCWLGKAIKEGK